MQAAVETAVQQVCQVMRSALQSSPQQSYLRPLLTSHVLLGEHEAALQLIKQVSAWACLTDLANCLGTSCPYKQQCPSMRGQGMRSGPGRRQASP